MKPHTFIFIGRSGCGKGTQSELLSEALKKKDASAEVLHIETGKKFRELVKGEGYTNDMAREIIEKGGLQPEFLAITIWGGEFLENLKAGTHLILDGFPRREHEAEILDQALKFYKREKPAVVLLEVSEEWAFERLKARSRKDDNDEGIRRRLAWYEADVIPAIHFFKNNPDYNFVEINGVQPIEKVHADILSKLGLA